VNVIEGTGKYSAQVLDRWMTMVTDVPGGSRGARLTQALLVGLQGKGFAISQTELDEFVIRDQGKKMAVTECEA
jgi:hypothetical protein